MTDAPQAGVGATAAAAAIAAAASLGVGAVTAIVPALMQYSVWSIQACAANGTGVVGCALTLVVLGLPLLMDQPRFASSYFTAASIVGFIALGGGIAVSLAKRKRSQGNDLRETTSDRANPRKPSAVDVAGGVEVGGRVVIEEHQVGDPPAWVE